MQAAQDGQPSSAPAEPDQEMGEGLLVVAQEAPVDDADQILFDEDPHLIQLFNIRSVAVRAAPSAVFLHGAGESRRY